MNDDLFGYLLLSGPLCGIIMVLGGILLLYKGAITLNNSSEGALSVEFKKELRITTQYPALGIFIIGLLFIIVPAFLGKPTEVQRLTIKAQPINVSEPVTVELQGAGWSRNFPHNGPISETHRPEFDMIIVRFSAEGYEPITRSFQLSDLTNNIAYMGEIEFTESVQEEIPKNEDAIANPEGVELPDIDTESSFGGTVIGDLSK